MSKIDDIHYHLKNIFVIMTLHNQEKIIKSILEKNNFVLMPTGGKSFVTNCPH